VDGIGVKLQDRQRRRFEIAISEEIAKVGKGIVVGSDVGSDVGTENPCGNVSLVLQNRRSDITDMVLMRSHSSDDL
jgi:hypothetical protein